MNYLSKSIILRQTSLIMADVFDAASHFLQGKPLYPAIRRILNLIFNSCTTSFIYKINYGNYTLLDVTDYKGIFEFFINGRFIIPLGIFCVVYYSTNIIAVVLFTSLSHFRSLKFQRSINKGFSKRKLKEMIEGINKVSEKLTTIVLTPENLREVYLTIKTDEPDFFKKIEDVAKVERENIEANFNTLVRASIAISIFKYSLPEFGMTLFVIIILSIICMMIFSVGAFILIDAIPAVVSYIKQLGEQSLARAQNSAQVIR